MVLVVISPEEHSFEIGKLQLERAQRVDRISHLARIYLEGHLGVPFLEKDRASKIALQKLLSYERAKTDPRLEELFHIEIETALPYENDLKRKEFAGLASRCEGLETEDTMRWTLYGPPVAYILMALSDAQTESEESDQVVPLGSKNGVQSAIIRLDKIEDAAKKEFPKYQDFDLRKLPVIRTSDGEALRALTPDTCEYVHNKILPEFSDWYDKTIVKRRTEEWAKGLLPKLQKLPAGSVVIVTCGTRHAAQLESYPQDRFLTIGAQLNCAGKGFSTLTLNSLRCPNFPAADAMPTR